MAEIMEKLKGERTEGWNKSKFVPGRVSVPENRYDNNTEVLLSL
jgi:hypothetical protein